MDWQPIETAPINGEFLVFGGVIKNAKGREVSANVVALVSNVAPGFLISSRCFCDTLWVEGPTHWLPINPPVEGGAP